MRTNIQTYRVIISFIELGVGIVVSLLAFQSDKSRLSPAEVYRFYSVNFNFLEKPRK